MTDPAENGLAPEELTLVLGWGLPGLRTGKVWRMSIPQAFLLHAGREAYLLLL